MPAMYETDFRLAQGQIDAAEKTAGGISVAEVRDGMLDLVKAHRAAADARSNGEPREATAALLDFGRSLQQLPERARWDPSMNLIWRVNRKYLAYEWRKLAGSFPDDALLLYRAGSSLAGVQNYPDAILYLRAATGSPSLDPSLRGNAWYELGRALLDSGQAAEAELPLLAATQQHPAETNASCALADVYKQSGRPDQAERALAGCPGHGQEKIPKNNPGRP